MPDDNRRRPPGIASTWGPLAGAAVAFIVTGVEISKDAPDETAAVGFFTLGMVTFGFWLRGIANHDRE